MRVLLCPAFPWGGWEGIGQGAEGHLRRAAWEKLPESILVKEEEGEGGRGWGRVTGKLL